MFVVIINREQIKINVAFVEQIKALNMQVCVCFFIKYIFYLF